MRIKETIKNKGFTMVELLVVISIIGILATLLLANYNATRSRARDVQRKSDLRNIQTALRIYYNDEGEYPTSGAAGSIKGCDGASCAWGEPFVGIGTTYMSVLPADPQSPDRDYSYTWIDSDTYTLGACLENASECDTACGAEFGEDLNGCVYQVAP